MIRFWQSRVNRGLSGSPSRAPIVRWTKYRAPYRPAAIPGRQRPGSIPEVNLTKSGRSRAKEPPVRLGISVPTRHPDGRLLSSPELALRAVAIEEAGFDSIWIGESINRG